MTRRKIKAITLTALMVLSVVAVTGPALGANVERGGNERTFNPGVGGPSEVVITEDKTVVFRGEDGVDFVNQNGTAVDAATLVGTSGNAEGIPLEEPIPEDQTLGQYAISGLQQEAGVTVQQPRVTDIDLLNQGGADVSDSSVPEDETLLVSAEWNFQRAEDLDIEVLDENGNEITGDVLTSTDDLSQTQLDELTGPYADNPEAVGNPGQRGTGTEQVFLQGAGQFNETELDNASIDAAYWALDMSDQTGGQYTITVEGWDDLDFGPAARTTTVNLTTDTDVSIDLDNDNATRGQNIGYTIRGSSAGDTHFVTIDSDDFRNDQVDERVFRDVQDVVDRGRFPEGTNASAEFAFAEVVIDEDTGIGEGQIDTTFLDDTNVDVNVYESDLTLENVSETFNDPEDDNNLRVGQGGLTIDEPAGTYIAGQEVDVRGTAQPGIEDVALYARDQGDWELLDVSEDGQLDDSDLIAVDADGEWDERDVRLSDATDIFAIPGRYRFGVIEAEDARGADGSLQQTLSTTEFSSGSSEQTSIIVTEPGLGPAAQSTDALASGSAASFSIGDGAAQQVTPPNETDRRPLIFQSYNGQVATDDGTVDVIGTAPGQDDVLLVMIDTRGRVATEQVTVDDNDVFEEDDVPLVTQDGRELNEGQIFATVYAVGRDGVAGDGIIPGQNDADISSVESYIQGFSGTGLTQQQVREIVADETINEAGSDDLFIDDEFRYTDGATSIDTVRAAGSDATGINAVQPGDTVVVSGVTNRKPDDNTIAVDVTEGPSFTEFPSESTDEWNFTGQWQVQIEVPQTVEPGNYTLEADDGDNTDIVTLQVTEAQAGTPGNATETPAANVTETPAENVTETPADGTETPAENVTETPADGTEPPAEVDAEGQLVQFASQTTDGDSITVESVNLTRGGYIVVHDESLAEGDTVGSVIGSTAYFDAGEYENVTVPLDANESFSGTQSLTVMLHRDTNGNQEFDFVESNGSADGPLTQDGTPVTASADVTIEAGTPTPETDANQTAVATSGLFGSGTSALLAGFVAVGALVSVLFRRRQGGN
jgi:hypothetical protein